MLDGEGTIGFTRKIDANWYFPTIIAVHNTNRRIIVHMRRLLGPAAKVPSPRQAGTNHKPLYKVLVTRLYMRQFLQGIRPYLLAKRVQCDAVLKFLDIADNMPVRCVPADQYEAIHRVVRKANTRGWEDDHGG